MSEALNRLKLSKDEESAWERVKESVGKKDQGERAIEVDALKKGLSELTTAVAKLAREPARPSEAKEKAGATWARVAARERPSLGQLERQVVIGGGSRDMGRQKTAGQVAISLRTRDLDIKARKLPGGAFALTFPSAEAKRQWVAESHGKVEEVLGEGAGIKEHTYDVIVSGLPAGSVSGMSDQQRLDLASKSGSKAKRAGVMKPSRWRSTESIVLGMASPEEANRVIEQGVAWNHGIYRAEPYSKGVRVVRCYRCQGYGHMASRCRGAKKCGWCAGDHRMEDCPEKGKTEKKACAPCGGARDHCALDAGCPARLREEVKAKQAYNTRPRQFGDGARKPPQPRAPTVLRPEPDEEGFIIVEGGKRKRAPGRPSALSLADKSGMPSIAACFRKALGTCDSMAVDPPSYE